MPIELGILIVTGVLSGLDVVVNLFGFCMTGRCRSRCCGASFSHHENDDSSSDENDS